MVTADGPNFPAETGVRSQAGPGLHFPLLGTAPTKIFTGSSSRSQSRKSTFDQRNFEFANQSLVWAPGLFEFDQFEGEFYQSQAKFAKLVRLRSNSGETVIWDDFDHFTATLANFFAI